MKAAFVDGASFYHMRRNMGMGESFSHAGCRSILEEIGSNEPLLLPVAITVVHSVSANEVRELMANQFRPILTSSRGGQDDLAIILGIDKISPAEIHEIILVSSDKDFIPILRCKYAEGIRITLLATRTPQKDGRRSIGFEMEKEFGRDRFQFVELSRYINRLRHPEDQVEPLRYEYEVY